MKLSVCILTYNRSSYLRKTLEHLFDNLNFMFRYEVIVCDNCSTDDTPDVVNAFESTRPELRYVRQTENVGAEANLVAAYHLARGEYIVYLADDDRLELESLGQILRFMDKNLEVGVCHCPWELWDDVEQKSQGRFYNVSSPRIFGRSDSLALCEFVLGNHIFPEICVYRAEIMRRVMYMPHRTYWAFVHVMAVLSHAQVAFLPTPYYRFITRHSPGEKREQHGNKQAVTGAGWDAYRGGLEAMIHQAFRLQGMPGVPDKNRQQVAQNIQMFINMRMQVALRLLIGSKDFIAAYDVLIRLSVANALPPDQVRELHSFLAGRGALQRFLQIYNSTTQLERIGLYAMADALVVQKLLHDMQNNLTIEILSDDNLAREDKSRIFIMTSSHESRCLLVQMGFWPGLVHVERDLMSTFAS
ncbi:glycosyltransferase family 2 protein [Microvirga lenta]|uniref:glycosyltransferase family 2 protein n=1 Tax=Microvirga lenta TaxID=2881337 RepID=UPI00299CFAB5|nr:glycosyltransferase family 2 protein [Microvirga lenta]